MREGAGKNALSENVFANVSSGNMFSPQSPNDLLDGMFNVRDGLV